MSYTIALLCFILLPAILLAKPSSTTIAASELSFLSGVADTTQRFSLSQKEQLRSNNSGEDGDLNKFIIERHHLVCFYKGPFPKRKSAYNTGSEKCCNELWLQGLIESHQKQYCLDRIARIPDVPSPTSLLESRSKDIRIRNKDAKPMYYLAIDHEVPQNNEHGVVTFPYYRQIRRVKARDEHRERETIRDLTKYGVSSYSPFHLVGFMPSVHDVQQHYNQAGDATRNMLRITGRINSTLSSEGGMHRSFHQRITFACDEIKLLSTKAYSEKYQMSISATVFLPLMESVFIDVDDPFLVEYHDNSPEPLLCRSSLLNNSLMGEDLLSPFTCNIQFISFETIDIEQPSFASRQYVVAFQIEAKMEFSKDISLELFQGLQVGIDYGTKLHIRYLLPIRNNHGAFGGASNSYGMVPLSIQQPILYNAAIHITEKDNNDSALFFILNTDAPLVFHSNPEQFPSQDPVIVHVAVGFDGDYWWVTSITMISALIGGFVIMKSIDSVSIWC